MVSASMPSSAGPEGLPAHNPGQDRTLQALFQKLRSLGKENHTLFPACRFPEGQGMLAAQPPAKAEYTPALHAPKKGFPVLL
jgi:hypothetical protein